MLVFHSVGHRYKISSYFLFLLFKLFGVRSQILLASLPARRRELTINFLLGFSVKSHKHWLPSPKTCEVRRRCLFQRSEHRGVRKNCTPCACGLSSLAGAVALHVLWTLLPCFVCKVMLLWQDLRYSGNISLFQIQSTNTIRCCSLPIFFQDLFLFIKPDVPVPPPGLC